MELDQLISLLSAFAEDAVLLSERTDGTGAGLRIVWCNDAAIRQTGHARDGLIGQSPAILGGPQTSAETIGALERAIMDGHGCRHALQNHRADGTAYWIRLTLLPVPRGDAPPRYWISLFTDISERVALGTRLSAAEAEVREARERLWSAIEALPDGFVLYDSTDRLVACNTRYRTIYSATGDGIAIGQTFEEVLRAGLANGQYPEAEGREEDWLHWRLANHRDPGGPLIQELPGNRFLKVHEVRTETGDTVGFRSDITALKRQEQELQAKAAALADAMAEIGKLANTDALTGLGNRRGLDTALRTRLDRECGDRPLAILHIDLDRFKPINDVFGHTAGDHVLRQVADILRGAIRTGDYVARVGGDEFAAILVAGDPDRDMEADVSRIADRIIADCSHPVLWSGKKLHFGTSIGISIGPAAEVQRLMQDADIALYEAKKAGRNRSALFTPELRSAVEAKAALTEEFLNAMPRGEIRVHFQPQVDAEDFAFAGAEALVRWHHPTQGVLAPGAFLPIAEDLGLMADLDQMILDQALSVARAAATAGTPLPGLSVNVSRNRLSVLQDAAALKDLAPFPCPIAFELLETIDFDADDSLSWTLDRLREIGIGIEFDDFGSGRASLTTLLKFRPDRIKIDRRIVAAALSPVQGAAAMIRGIAEMAQGLGIAMTAEGIETAEQAAYMRALGCDRLQGYFTGRPMTAEALLDRLAGERAGPAVRPAV
ncbi:EAL domain-containing protein [Rhodobacterales bacterium HKCCE3408]|nr:EAL domain-containing protein [Rhodobacterales bacterium HKCCE3408]